VLGVQVSSTAWETVGVPSPERVIFAGEFVALLATVTLPDTLPAVRGENVASKVADCPGARVKPAEMPLAEYCVPETITLETITSELPAFVSMTVKALLFPRATFPKLRLVVLVVRRAVAAIPVPLKDTVLGELETSLMTETLPDKAPAVFGAKMTLNVDCFPASIVKGSVIPVIVTPAAVVLACVTLRFDPPPFVIVTD
jgi:hypothetical protein